MNNRILAAAALLALGLGSTVLNAGDRYDDDRGRDRDHRYERDYDRHDDRDRHRGRDRARVVHVEPVYERVRYSVPVEHCWNERVRHVRRGSDRTAATVVGGAVGAVIGNRIGDGRGVATVAGAAVGAVIGSELARGERREVHYDTVRRCEVRHEPRFERRVVAYHVTYELRGRRDVTRLAYDPGRYIAVADIRRRG